MLITNSKISKKKSSLPLKKWKFCKINIKNIIVYFMIISNYAFLSCSHSKGNSVLNPNDQYKPKKGDDVKIITANGNEYKFFITEITPDSIKSEKYNIPIKDIQSIEKIKNHPVLLLVVLVGFLTIPALLFLANGSFSIGRW